MINRKHSENHRVYLPIYSITSGACAIRLDVLSEAEYCTFQQFFCLRERRNIDILLCRKQNIKRNVDVSEIIFISQKP